MNDFFNLYGTKGKLQFMLDMFVTGFCLGLGIWCAKFILGV